MLGLDLARVLRLPFKVIEESLGFLKNEKAVEVLGGDLIGRISYTVFNFQAELRTPAVPREAMKLCTYVGPAPVPLEDYVEQTYRQAVTAIDVSPEAISALRSATSSSAMTCSTPSDPRSSAASRCSSTGLLVTARRPLPRQLALT